MADSLQELIERLRQPLGREETLQAWDHWRRLMKQTRSSLPRDAFEAWCELQDEEERFPAAEALSSAHSEIERLRGALDDGIATLMAVRATASGDEWPEAALHFHDLCGETIARMNSARTALSQDSSDGR